MRSHLHKNRSGSMSGGRIKQVAKCMKILLKSLTEGTLFNIVGFGSGVVTLDKFFENV